MNSTGMIGKEDKRLKEINGREKKMLEAIRLDDLPESMKTNLLKSMERNKDAFEKLRKM